MAIAADKPPNGIHTSRLDVWRTEQSDVGDFYRLQWGLFSEVTADAAMMICHLTSFTELESSHKRHRETINVGVFVCSSAEISRFLNEEPCRREHQFTQENWSIGPDTVDRH